MTPVRGQPIIRFLMLDHRRGAEAFHGLPFGPKTEDLRVWGPGSAMERRTPMGPAHRPAPTGLANDPNARIPDGKGARCKSKN